MTVLAVLSLSTEGLARPPIGIYIGPGPGPMPPPRGPLGPPIPPVDVVIPPPPIYHHHYWSSDYGSDSTVASVQRALKRRGYYAGPVDGDVGRETRGAILAFREDHGLSPTSRIDRSLLRALGL